MQVLLCQIFYKILTGHDTSYMGSKAIPNPRRSALNCMHIAWPAFYVCSRKTDVNLFTYKFLLTQAVDLLGQNYKFNMSYHTHTTLQWRHNGAMASQITSLTIVYSTIYSDADQRKHQSSAWLAFVRGIHRYLDNSPHKWPITRNMFPFDDIIIISLYAHEQFVSVYSLELYLEKYPQQELPSASVKPAIWHFITVKNQGGVIIMHGRQ